MKRRSPFFWSVMKFLLALTTLTHGGGVFAFEEERTQNLWDPAGCAICEGEKDPGCSLDRY